MDVIGQYAFFNCLSVCAIVSFVSVAAITVVYRLNPKRLVTVNCWFCNGNAKLCRAQLDWWRCPTCEQYNGFAKDGDYAYDIPEQRARPIDDSSTTSKRAISDSKNSLCDRCNRNQELKVFELRAFEPKTLFGSSGLAEFKDRLEFKYPLCESCDRTLQDVLRKQSAWLVRRKIQSFKAKSAKSIAHNANKLDKIVRFLLAVVSSAIMYYPSYRALPFLGIFLQMSAFAIDRAHRSKNVLLLLMWVCIGALGSRSYINFWRLRGAMANDWPNFGSVNECHLVILLSIVIGLTNVTSRYGKVSRCTNASFKKLESPLGKQNSATSLMANHSIRDFNWKSRECNAHRESTESTRPSVPIAENSSQTKFAAFTDCPRKHEKSTSGSISGGGGGSSGGGSSGSSSSSSSNSSSEIGQEPSRRRGVESKFERNGELYSLVESLKSLKTLTLGNTSSVGRSSQILPRVFETRVYGSTSPELFQSSIKPSPARTRRRRFVLAPPKLKSVAQSSWVAGGYWQFGQDFPSLSRSSSQSSGFGSAGSNFAPSREPSVYNDRDACTLASETSFRFQAPSCNGPMPKFCGDGYGVGAGGTESSNVSVIQETSRPSDRYSLDRLAVLTSPVWLSILLCGSLVFNVAVFCTVLLR